MELIKELLSLLKLNQEKEKNRIPRSVQQAIPIKKIYEDGIFQVGMNKYSKTYKFTDTNYMVSGKEEQERMFLDYGSMTNTLDCGSLPKVTIINRRLNKIDFENKIKMPIGNDNLTPYREDINMVFSKNSLEAQGVIQEKLLTITVNKKNINEAERYFSSKEIELGNSFAKLDSKLTELDINERLRIFYDFFRSGEEDLYHFDIKASMQKGHSFKDYICPDTFEFKVDYFKMQNRYGRVLFLKEFATFIKDDIISELTDLNKNMMLSIDMKPIPREEAIKLAEKKIMGVETNIAKWQKSQNENNNFSAELPYDLQRQREESKEFLNDLIERDQKMFLSTITIVHTADTKEELENDTEYLKGIAGRHLCQLGIFRYQQLDALNTVMPYGIKKVKITRTLTTESLSAFMPMKVQEMQDAHGIYYGKNAISKNMILIDRHELLNGNSFILGVSGSGKSFAAKQEIAQIALRDKNADILILDPEAEYKSLIEDLGGEVIKISANSSNHINALDINEDYGESKDPIKDKSEFVLSLCEQIMGTDGAIGKHKSLIDRCISLVYKNYIDNNYKGTPPTLEDFRQVLLRQKDPEAREIALSIELFTKGSLNTFAKQTNVEVTNRMICYDIIELGEQLMPVGMLVILDSILNRISKNRKTGKTTYIFIDEIYLLFKHEYTSYFIEKLWRRIRKYGGFATGITQNVSELLDKEEASRMLSNSELIVMLNQSTTDRDRLADFLHIPEKELSFITNANTGEGLIKARNSIIPFKNVFPKGTKLYKLMTTKPKENFE